MDEDEFDGDGVDRGGLNSGCATGRHRQRQNEQDGPHEFSTTFHSCPSVPCTRRATGSGGNSCRMDCQTTVMFPYWAFISSSCLMSSSIVMSSAPTREVFAVLPCAGR